jgi:hypothetical protein
MADKFSFPGNYRIEVSGWGLDRGFFVEKTDLLWSSSGGKQVQLHRTLPEGAMIFVRLLAEEAMDRSAPVAFQVQGIKPMDCEGQCEMSLVPVRPRSKKAPQMARMASHMQEDSSSTCEPSESSMRREPEEVLQ